MELTTLEVSAQVLTPREIIDSPKTEFDKINATNATICWYSPTDGSEQFVKFADLPEDQQQSIRRGLEAFEQGHFISLDDYEQQIQR
ncbi:hypothetical protein [Laspinema olomoucense]|uniref:KTSC domain-containing protein n=1 Tax=Laspinema olomoucense D3b TaxID=2953688 RepID=A0ABT2NC42_9CYAN|nr:MULTISPECIES: hypothetical protein [unclassified Laspinema]MCT7980132.1 hypothetical protein [Laspinema sp. D3b]MCT7992109.1 hypothetical protein [Laspinema sp. D3c]